MPAASSQQLIQPPASPISPDSLHVYGSAVITYDGIQKAHCGIANATGMHDNGW
jgi:hypothetical protein